MSNELLTIAAIAAIVATLVGIYYWAPPRLRVQLMAAAGFIGAGLLWLTTLLSRKAPPPPEKPRPEPTPPPSKEWRDETDRITKEIEDDLQTIAREKSEALKTVDSGVADAGFVDWLDDNK